MEFFISSRGKVVCDMSFKSFKLKFNGSMCLVNTLLLCYNVNVFTPQLILDVAVLVAFLILPTFYAFNVHFASYAL